MVIQPDTSKKADIKLVAFSKQDKSDRIIENAKDVRITSPKSTTKEPVKYAMQEQQKLQKIEYQVKNYDNFSEQSSKHKQDVQSRPLLTYKKSEKNKQARVAAAA